MFVKFLLFALGMFAVFTLAINSKLSQDLPNADQSEDEGQITLPDLPDIKTELKALEDLIPQATASTPQAKKAPTSDFTLVKSDVGPVGAVATSAITLPIAKTVTISAPTTTLVVPPPNPTINFENINQNVRKALVNIICTTTHGGSFEPATASGVIIDPRGVILTNAHAAMYYLIRNYLTKDFIDCTIRQGSPAHPLYKADLLYISPTWVREHYKSIIDPDPLGTGENDYALLLIKSGVSDGVKLPIEFSYIPIETADLIDDYKKQVLLAGYPAGFLGGIAIQRDLYPVTSIATIGTVYTFTENTPDLVSVGGSPTAQKGSSGGPVVNDRGHLIGMISTEKDAKTTDARDLRAITVSHINRSFKIDSGLNISQLLGNDLASFSEIFNTTIAPELTALLIKAIERR